MANLVAKKSGVQDVQVFWLREFDAVVAQSLDEALSWYKDFTGLSDDDLYDYDEIEIIPPNYKVQKSEDDTQLIPVKEIVEKHFNLKPFIITTTGGHFHIELNHFFEGWNAETKNDFFSVHNLDKETIKTASYVEMKLNNKNRECYVTFKNDSFEAISKILKEDWCAIMDSLYKNKWYGKYELINSVKILDSY